MREVGRREHAGVRSSTPVATRASAATADTRAYGSSAPAAARACGSSTSAGTRASSAATPRESGSSIVAGAWELHSGGHVGKLRRRGQGGAVVDLALEHG